MQSSTSASPGFSPGSLAALAQAHREVLHGFVVRIQEPGAKVGSAAAVDDGGAHDVRPLSEREPLGDAIVYDGLAIAVDADDLLAVDPPHGGRVGADGQAHVAHFTRAIDDGHGPE